MQKIIVFMTFVCCCVLWIYSANHVYASRFSMLLGDVFSKEMSFQELSRTITERTSIDFAKPFVNYHSPLESFDAFYKMWLILPDLAPLLEKKGSPQYPAKVFRSDIVRWLLRGGFLMVESEYGDLEDLKSLIRSQAVFAHRKAAIRRIEVEHELLQSYYLLDSMPACDGGLWAELRFDSRMMVLFVPKGFIHSLSDQSSKGIGCFAGVSKETLMRGMINIIMVSFTTDYKKDQIHLPEILKRMR